ncbi:peptidoglycan-binding protein [Bacillus sp. NP157]|nr:peptidoglycan-binding protein [Bacillus sp. NP157]
MPTELQLRTISAIVNVFETSSVVGHYSAVTFNHADAGHLSYGRAQASLASGSLGRLLQAYVANAAATFGKTFAPYVPRALAVDTALDHDMFFQNLLRAVADDKAMRDTQDDFFAKNYLMPAVQTATRAGITTPLGMALAYDAYVQGGWGTVRDLTNAAVGAMPHVDEKTWLKAYIVQRRRWLTGLASQAHDTGYRMDAFQRLVDLGQWDLGLPLVVRSLEISAATLSATPEDCYDDSHPVGSRDLGLGASGVLRGLDVRRLQVGLSASQPLVVADGVFGRGTADAVKAYQGSHGSAATGTASSALVLELAQPR